MPYMDRGPMDRQPIGVPPQKRPRESTPNVMDSSRGGIYSVSSG